MWSIVYWLAEHLMKKSAVQCWIVGLTDLLGSKLRVGAGFLLHSTFTETLLRANDHCRHFGAVLTDVTHSRVGPWDLWLSFHWRGWPKPCPANSCIRIVSTELQRINNKPKKYLNWTILHTINKLSSICTSTCVHIQHFDTLTFPLHYIL
jgi:hypothetical protein